MNHTSLGALLLAVLVVGGCSRKMPAPPAPATPVASSPMPADPAVAEPPPPPPPPAAAVASPSDAAPADAESGPRFATPVDAQIQQMIIRFYKENDRPAMSWNDLLGKKYIPAIPRGPDGKPLDWDATMQRIGKASDRSRK